MLKISIKQGDLCQEKADALVNPANSYGFMGGGAAAAIKRAGGEEIEREAVAQAPIPVGTAVTTHAGSLKAHYIIHAPTMEQPGQMTDAGRIQDAVLAAIRVADSLSLKKIAMPGMGTGVGSVPKNVAARAIIDAIISYKPSHLVEVVIVAFGDDLKEALDQYYSYILTKLKG